MAAIDEITKLSGNMMSNIPLLAGINNDTEHQQALELMEALLDEYDNNLVIIEALSNVIKRYEDGSQLLDIFNRRQKGIDPAVATLKVLMEQNGLKTADFEAEIGKKSMVSQVLSGRKNLTREHIQKLAKRFGIKPAAFF